MRQEIDGIYKKLVVSRENQWMSTPWIRCCATQSRFKVNVWASVTWEHLIRPYLLLFSLTRRNYLLFLQQVLLQILENRVLHRHNRQCCPHDGAPVCYSQNVCNHQYVGAKLRYRLWCQIMSCDQGRPLIILCTPIKLQKITLI